ncbi:MAG: transcription antitermination factor NusB [Spirochaetes bacterium]|nr:transcription antitermination factor NusB [Spirochaetota bacterium]
MGHRRKAREYAMQALYMYETVRTPVEELVTLHWVDKEIPEDIRDFAITLIEGTIANVDYIDSLIKQYSKNWKFERINPVDKSILRISIYALLYLDSIPHAVTIDEGIELGKIYGSENSGQFINGILDAIRVHELQTR